MTSAYSEFLSRKQVRAISSGFAKPKDDMNDNLFEWQKDIDFWALGKGRARDLQGSGRSEKTKEDNT